MSPTLLTTARDVANEFDSELCVQNGGVPHVVVVDPQFDGYEHLAAASRRGEIDIHFRSSGAEALKLARRTRVDVWLVAAELDDVSGADFVTLLQGKVGASQLAIVESSAAGTAAASSAAVLSPPITLDDVERLLGRSTARPPVLPYVASTVVRPFVTLPMGVSAAVAAVAVLVLG